MTRAKKIEEAARAHIEKMRFVDCGLTTCEMTACAIARLDRVTGAKVVEGDKG